MRVFNEIAENKSNMFKYDVSRMSGSKHNATDRWRLRIRKYRAVFDVIDETLYIVVIDIDSRGDIYKRY